MPLTKMASRCLLLRFSVCLVKVRNSFLVKGRLVFHLPKGPFPILSVPEERIHRYIVQNWKTLSIKRFTRPFTKRTPMPTNPDCPWSFVISIRDKCLRFLKNRVNPRLISLVQSVPGEFRRIVRGKTFFHPSISVCFFPIKRFSC